MTPRDRRTLIAGAALIVAIVVAGRGLPAWRAWKSSAQAIAAETMADAARMQAAIAGFGASLDSLEARTARLLQLRPTLLVGKTSAEAAAMLTAVVAEAARVSLVRLDAVETRLAADSGTLQRVSLDAQATADITGLAALLGSLERGPTLLAVRRLTIHPQSTASPSGPVEQLSIRLALEGLALVRDRGEER